MAEESALGKPIGGDLREGKVTLPIILLLQRAGPEAAELVHSVIADGQVTPERWRAIKDLLACHGAVEVRVRARRLRRRQRETAPADVVRPVGRAGSPDRPGRVHREPRPLACTCESVRPRPRTSRSHSPPRRTLLRRRRARDLGRRVRRADARAQGDRGRSIRTSSIPIHPRSGSAADRRKDSRRHATSRQC